jgi:hypothetical protein
MAFYDPLTKPLAALKPSRLKELADTRLSSVVLRELSRSRERVEDLQRRYPTAPPRELAQRLVDDKKGMASLFGGMSGALGIVGVPLDFVGMVWFQLSLLTDVATLYKVNLKSSSSRKELLDLFGYANGIGPITRAGPKVLGKLAAVLLEKGGLKTFGRAVPLVSAPLSAYLNNLHIQKIGDEAVRHYEGFDRAREKSRKAAGE